MRALGVKTLLYTDPNRTIAGEPDAATDDTAFARDCSGERIGTNRSAQYLMDPHAPAVAAVWKQHVDRYAAEGHFDAVLNDDADDIAYVHGVPCHYNASDWLAATNALQRSLRYPVVYNGLSNFTDGRVSESIGLNETAIGGMMEECYAASPSQPEVTGSQWRVAENTELLMAAAHKYFFCYNNDTSDADRSLDARLYVYASFLLSYDPSSSVLWEYYAGPSAFHVMPEVQLVPERPFRGARSIEDLRQSGGTYARAYHDCSIAGRHVGRCIVAVNPDDAAHPLDAAGYKRTLVLSGAGILDGGTVRVAASAPPQQLGPHAAVILFE